MAWVSVCGRVCEMQLLETGRRLCIDNINVDHNTRYSKAGWPKMLFVTLIYIRGSECDIGV